MLGKRVKAEELSGMVAEGVVITATWWWLL